MLTDSFGRIATDLRVSVTDRCNLRCSYCMPPEGLDWLPSPALLTDDEVSRLMSVAVRQLGVTEIRFTGGEPLLRRGLPGLVAAAAALDPRPEISLTTNGIGLARLAGTLAAAGLDRLNVSLDTLSPQTFKELARRDRLPDVLAGLAAAASAGLAPVKVNAVLMPGVNDHEAPGMLHFGICLRTYCNTKFTMKPRGIPNKSPMRVVSTCCKSVCGSTCCSHSSGGSTSGALCQVSMRWRRLGCTGPLTIPALWPPLVSRKV